MSKISMQILAKMDVLRSAEGKDDLLLTINQNDLC